MATHNTPTLNVNAYGDYVNIRAAVANKIGMNYPGLTLLKHLDSYYPDRVCDPSTYDFIMQRVDAHNREYELWMSLAAKEGNNDPSNPVFSAYAQEASYEADKVLMNGFNWSEFEIVKDAIKRADYMYGGNEARQIYFMFKDYYRKVFARHTERFFKIKHPYKGQYQDWYYDGSLDDDMYMDFTSTDALDKLEQAIYRVTKNKVVPVYDEMFMNEETPDIYKIDKTLREYPEWMDEDDIAMLKSLNKH